MVRSHTPADQLTDASASPATRIEPDPGAPPRPAGAEPPAPLDPLAPWRPPPPAGLGERLAELGRHLPVEPGRALAVALLAVLAAGAAWWFLRPPPPPVEAALPLAGSSTAPGAPGSSTADVGPGTPAGSVTSTTVAAEFVVQAAGAVGYPGVYRLSAGSRVDDLVRAAGGLSPEADLDRLNLAAPVADGERVWVPRRGEPTVPEVVAGTGGGSPSLTPGGAGGATGTSAALPSIVNLNTATAEELDTLPGVGPATATAILAYRDENGSFSSVDELLEVRGIGDAKLEQLRPMVTV